MNDKFSNMKRFSKIIIIAAFAIVAFPLACKKSFLYQTNTFQGSAVATFNKAQDVISLVNAIYDTYQNSDLLKKSIWYWANFETHDFFNWGGDVMWNNYQIPATFGAINTFWTYSYIGVARANAAFKVIVDAQARGIIDAPLASRLTGEAYFLRGLASGFRGAALPGPTARSSERRHSMKCSM